MSPMTAVLLIVGIPAAALIIACYMYYDAR